MDFFDFGCASRAAQPPGVVAPPPSLPGLGGKAQVPHQPGQGRSSGRELLHPKTWRRDFHRLSLPFGKLSLLNYWCLCTPLLRGSLKGFLFFHAQQFLNLGALPCCCLASPSHQ